MRVVLLSLVLLVALSVAPNPAPTPGFITTSTYLLDPQCVTIPLAILVQTTNCVPAGNGSSYVTYDATTYTNYTCTDLACNVGCVGKPSGVSKL
jgi:hypothetical protein